MPLAAVVAEGAETSKPQAVESQAADSPTNEPPFALDIDADSGHGLVHMAQAKPSVVGAEGSLTVQLRCGMSRR